MEKAWDFKVLAEGLKAKGLDLAEDAAKEVAVAVIDWVEASVQLSENKFDDLAMSILPLAKAELLKLVDKIDGQEG
jgi:uncharacterized protein YjfI (DUF2170 family)